MGSPAHPDFDYIVIGSGAGGGPVAANLARAGYKVGLIEAGQAPEPAAYSVPSFHGFATEDPDLSWAFFVRHYGSLDRSRRVRRSTCLPTQTSSWADSSRMRVWPGCCCVRSMR